MHIGVLHNVYYYLGGESNNRFLAVGLCFLVLCIKLMIMVHVTSLFVLK